jgi:molybdopterin-binding protein
MRPDGNVARRGAALARERRIAVRAGLRLGGADLLEKITPAAKKAKGATTAHVKIDIGGTIVTSSITNAAVDDLKLAVGKNAYAVIKASDVMIGID